MYTYNRLTLSLSRGTSQIELYVCVYFYYLGCITARGVGWESYDSSRCSVLAIIGEMRLEVQWLEFGYQGVERLDRDLKPGAEVVVKVAEADKGAQPLAVRWQGPILHKVKLRFGGQFPSAVMS